MNKTTLRLPAQTYPIRRRVDLENGGGYTTVPDGSETVELTAEIDLGKLARALGEKAGRSSKGVSKLQDGAVTVRVVGRRRERPVGQ